MLEENSIGLICEEFEKSVKEFALSDDKRPFYQIASSYFKEDVKEKKGYVYYNNFIIVFVYCFETSIASPKSILECRICFSKNGQGYEHPFYDVLGLINPHDFKCYFFPYIECSDRMRSCFSVLAKAVKSYLPDILSVADDGEKLAFLAAQRQTNLKTLCGRFYHTGAYGEEWGDGFYHSLYHMIFTAGRYNDFLKGKYKKATKRYLKAKRLIGYEKRLLDFLLQMPPGEQYNAVEPELNTLDEGLKQAAGSGGLGLALFSILCFTPFMLAAFAAAYLLAVKLIYTNALYVTNLDLNSAMNMLLPAILASFLVSYFWRVGISKRIFPKNHAKHSLYDKILNRRHEERLMRRFACVAATGCLIFLFLAVNSNIAFYNNGFSNNLKFFSLAGEYIRYDSIDSVWEISGRKNSLGIWADNPYYIILLKNGRRLDFSDDVYGYQFTEKIIPILTEKGIKSRASTSEDEVALSG